MAREDRRAESVGSWPAALWLYVIGAVGLGLSALFGGGTLLLDPTGSTLGLPVAWLV